MPVPGTPSPAQQTSHHRQAPAPPRRRAEQGAARRRRRCRRRRSGPISTSAVRPAHSRPVAASHAWPPARGRGARRGPPPCHRRHGVLVLGPRRLPISSCRGRQGPGEARRVALWPEPCLRRASRGCRPLPASGASKVQCWRCRGHGIAPARIDAHQMHARGLHGSVARPRVAAPALPSTRLRPPRRPMPPSQAAHIQITLPLHLCRSR